MPLANYEYFAPYIQRCQDGQTEALFGPDETLLMFALTSGTTAPAKYIPVTQTSADHYRRGWNVWGIKALADHPNGYLRKILQVTSPFDEETTSAGIPCGAISGMLARNQKFIVRRFYATSPEVAKITNPLARYYTIMRFAITQDVGFISTANPSTTLTLARTAAEHADLIIKDVRDGTLTPPADIDPTITKKLTRNLRPNPRRANQLKVHLSHSKALLPKDYWNLAFLANWTGGSTGLYIPQLREYFGDVPIRDIGLLASEGRFSIPVEDSTASGILDITSNFYEFIPRDQIDQLPDPNAQSTIPGEFDILQAHQLQLNQEYYIFITNTAGLYRYNMGDLVRVTGFAQQTPLIEFLSKGAHTSSITGEKLTENQVVTAVNAAAQKLSLHVDTFVLAPQWDDLPFYCLHCQSPMMLTSNDLRKLAQTTDENLIQTNIEYESKRKTHRLGPVQAQQTTADALTNRDHQLLSRNSGRAEQFKHRFLLKQPFAPQQ